MTMAMMQCFSLLQWMVLVGFDVLVAGIMGAICTVQML